MGRDFFAPLRGFSRIPGRIASPPAESAGRHAVNHVRAIVVGAYSFTPAQALSTNGTEAAPTGIWRAFRGNFVVNALALKAFLCICAFSSMPMPDFHEDFRPSIGTWKQGALSCR